MNDRIIVKTTNDSMSRIDEIWGKDYKKYEIGYYQDFDVDGRIMVVITGLGKKSNNELNTWEKEVVFNFIRDISGE